MEKKFWLDSWDLGGYKTSFHKREVHPYILKHLSPEVLKNKKILVPLCGKSVDMIYFRNHAAHVTGVEFVVKAIHQFFEEQQLPYTKIGNAYCAEKLTIVNLDFLKASVDDVGHVDLIYDRASLVALPLHLRVNYIKKISELMPLGSQQFVNTLEYHPVKPEPPFSITPQEVEEYYKRFYTIKHVEDRIVEDHGLKRVWGLDYVKEHGFILTKNRQQ